MPGAGWGEGPAGGAGRPSLGGAAGSWAFTSCAPHTHALCLSLPRARAGLCAQRHHHRGELPPSPPGRLGGRDGVPWEGCHSKVQVKGARGACPTHTFLSSRASQASWSGPPSSAHIPAPGTGAFLLCMLQSAPLPLPQLPLCWESPHSYHAILEVGWGREGADLSGQEENQGDGSWQLWAAGPPCPRQTAHGTEGSGGSGVLGARRPDPGPFGSSPGGV